MRGNKKGAISLRIRNLKRFIAEDERAVVITKFGELKAAFKDFDAAHAQYHMKLTEVADIIASDSYFEQVEDDYVAAMLLASNYVAFRPGQSPANPSVPSVLTQPAQSTSSAGLYVKLPALPKPDVFSGSPLLYPMWKASFDSLIGNHDRIGFDQKLYFLKMYTAGEAKSAIEALFLVPNESSYNAALEILKDRFGSSRLVTTAFRRRIDEWPRISDKDSKAIQRFADFLYQVKVARGTYKALDILDDQFENQKLVQKLPAWLAAKWVEKVVQAGDEEFPKFETFVDFIKEKAKEANHLLWDGRYQCKTDSSRTSSGHGQAKSNSLNSSSQESKGAALAPATQGIICVLCKSNHRVSKCQLFANMSLAERKSCIFRHRLCFGCLSGGHQSSVCRSRHVCGVCKKRHPTLLHDYSQVHVDQSENRQAPSEQAHQTLAVASETRCTHDGVPDLAKGGFTTMVVPVRVSFGSRETDVLALLDTQSNTHFVTDKVMSDLNLSGEPTNLQLSTMHGTKVLPTNVVEGLQVKGLQSGAECVVLSRCFSRTAIPFERGNVPTNESVSEWPHLSHIEIPDNVKHLKVGLLIGFTCAPAFRPLQFCTGDEDQPWGMRTKLGWCVVGPKSADGDVCESGDASHFVRGRFAFNAACKEIFVDSGVSSVDSSVNELVSDVKVSADDLKFLNIMEQGFWQDSDLHYSAPLPLKCDPNLPNNRGSALKRLDGLKVKLSRDSEYKAKYTAVMKESFDGGFFEPVPPEETQSGKVWYIPHHGVPKGQNQVRVVFDCSAKCQGICVNDVLLSGPNLLNEMLGICMRFRSDKVGMICDIQKMYYQFRVDIGHRDLLRFFWWPNGDTTLAPVEYRMSVHIFGAVSSSGVATYGLRKIALDHGSKYPPSVSEFITRDFYVDDGQTALNTVSEARELLLNTQKLLAEGGCYAHKVMSNSPELLQSIAAEDRAPGDGPMHKALGILWDTEADELCVRLTVSVKEVTKRHILSSLASIFDPLGLAAPLVLQARLLLQELCRASVSWDEPAPENICQRFEQWVGLLDTLLLVRVPRCQLPEFQFSKIELHHFADASSVAYAACSYVRFVGQNGEYHMSLVLGKCKVVPIKPVLTIPRLELMACVLAVRLALVCRRELTWPVVEYFWTDSSVVLGYIRNLSARFKVFVANRVQFIHSATDPSQWSHVPSADNPADDGSRAVQSERWLNGPNFLRQGVDMSEYESCGMMLDDDVEVCHDGVGEEIACDVKVFHDWHSTKKVMAWMLRFIHNSRPGSSRQTGRLSLLELDTAQRRIVQLIQRKHFSKEAESLAAAQRVPRDSRLFKLDVFLDQQGILRVGGRVRHGPLEYGLKHPVVLPGEHDVTWALVEHFHRLVHHQGRGITAGEVRSHGFWITGLNRRVKQVIQTCVTCRRLRGRPCEQKMADLPQDRLTPAPPFSHVACDCFGPFITKNGRKETKRYALLITCLACRAVHIEMLFSLSSDSFISAFRRFVCLRGPVVLLRCDQGTNFTGAVDVLLKMGCEVLFNPPDSSHRGGVVERMNGSARRVLEGILLEHGEQLNDEALMTMLCECAAIINSRPLNVLSIDDPLCLEPLTPNHLIMMKSKVVTTSPLPDPGGADLYSVKRWRRVQYLVDMFWSRWRKEIVHMLQARPKWNDARRNIKVDDIVLIVDELSHRSNWRLARVSEVTRSSDDLVRSATLVLPNGSKLVRPIQKLIFLVEA